MLYRTLSACTSLCFLAACGGEAIPDLDAVDDVALSAELCDDESRDDEGRDDPPVTARPLGTDKRLVVAAAGEEVSVTELGKFASRRTQEGSVRDYAEVLVAEHNHIAQQLMRLAQRRGTLLPAAMSSAGEKQLGTLARRSAAQFDREFLALQIGMQRDVSVTLARMQREARDAEVRAWAAEAGATWARDEAWARQIHTDLLTRGSRGDDHSDDPFAPR